MSKEKRRVPKLRFPGFTEDWEQRKLDDIAKIKTGGGTPKTTNLEYWSGDIPWIQSSDLVEGDVVHVNIKKFINNNALKNSAAKLISRDSIALVTRVGVGKVAVINQDFTTSQDFLSLSGFDGNDIKFIAYQLFRLMQENAKVLQGTSIKGITKTDLIEQSIAIPNSIKEQSLIANILSQTDSIITLHQRKLNNLKLKKKALLQKLFPKNEERYPELRFPGFTDAWEQRKLIYIFNDFIVPMRDKPKVFSGTTPWTRIEDIEGRYINTSLSGQFVSDETIKSMNLKVIPKGSLIVSASATFGVVAIVNNDLITNQTFIGLVPNKDFDIDFLYSLFEAPTTKGKLLKLSAGSTIFYIARESFENLVLSVPSKEEQIKISKVFKSIDDSITLHQRKLDHLQLQKKALLQQMFV